MEVPERPFEYDDCTGVMHRGTHYQIVYRCRGGGKHRHVVRGTDKTALMKRARRWGGEHEIYMEPSCGCGRCVGRPLCEMPVELVLWTCRRTPWWWC